MEYFTSDYRVCQPLSQTIWYVRDSLSQTIGYVRDSLSPLTPLHSYICTPPIRPSSCLCVVIPSPYSSAPAPSLSRQPPINSFFLNAVSLSGWPRYFLSCLPPSFYLPLHSLPTCQSLLLCSSSSVSRSPLQSVQSTCQLLAHVHLLWLPPPTYLAHFDWLRMNSCQLVSVRVTI